MRPYLNHWVENLFDLRKIRYLDICPTWKCNAKCPTCNAWKRATNQLSEKQASNIINEFKHLQRVVVEGGEPFLWKQLDYFVANLLESNKKVIVSIITNGFLTSKILKFAKTMMPYKERMRWSVSLNGIGEIHDASRGVKNVYERSFNTGKSLKELGYITTFSFVGLKPNIQDYPKVLELAKGLNMDVSVCYYTHRSKYDNLTWQPADKEDYEAILENRRTRYNLFDRWMYEYFLYHANRFKPMECWAGRSMAHINPDGIIRPCHMDESMEIGKVTDEEVYFNENIEDTLKLIPSACQYKDGMLCNDCYITWTTRRSMPKVFLWKLFHLRTKK